MGFKPANPGPLGLAAFGMTTILLNLHNAGFFPNTSVILGMGVFFGGLAQLMAGVMEFSKGNTFGTVAFSSYGCFWLSLVAVWVFPTLGWAEAPSHAFVGCYLALWGIFTCGMFIGTLKSGHVLRFVFLSLTILFWLLALGDFTESHGITVLAGWVGIICGASAVYLALAEVIAEQFGRKVLPH